MAKRDVQLVIRAKDEASRALASIADLLGQLDVKQKGAAASGKSFATSAVEAAQQLAQFERVTGLVVAASARAEQAIDGQRNAIKNTAAELNAVTRQLAAGQQAINSAQTAVVNNRLDGGDGKQQVAALIAARAASADLESQQGKLTRTLAAQESVLAAQESEFRQLASSANTAEAALNSFGDEAARGSLKAAVASEQAASALKKQTAAQEELSRASAARSFFDREPAASSNTSASKTQLADMLRLEDATEKVNDSLSAQAAAQEEVNRASQARAFFASEPVDTSTNTASKTALADMLRLEDASQRVNETLRAQAAAQEEVNRASQAQAFFDTEPMVAGIKARETALAELLQTEEAQAVALQRLQTRIDPLAAIERRLSTETKLLSKAFDEGAIEVNEYQRALDLLQKEAQNSRDSLDRVGKGAKGQIGLFGLKPYELTNLGYQANDLVTQIASGTPIFQAFAQQGGQILQLLPNIGAKIQAIFTNPYILGAAAAVGVFTIAMKEAGDQADRLRKIEGIVESAGRGADVTAEALVDVARQIERIGFSADEAVGLVRTFLVEGLNTDYLVQFAAAAEDLATVTGKELPDALEQQRAAFTAGYDAVAELDNALQFLTLAEREQIRLQFESGDAAGARAKAFELFEASMDDQADKSRGTWASAVKSLDKAFSDLLETLGSADFAQGFVKELEGLIQDIEFAFAKIDDLTKEQIDRQIAQINDRQERLQFDPLYRASGQAAYDRQIENQLVRQRDLIKENVKATGDLKNEQSESARKRENDQLAIIAQENRLSNARTAAQKTALEGEKAYQEARNAGHSVAVANARKEQAIERSRREESRKAEQERKQREAGFATAIAENGRQGLLTTAQSFSGLKETRKADADILSNLFKKAGENIDPKMVAWCAAFVNAVLATNGLPTVDQSGPGSDLRARDFQGYGSKVTKPEPGDIVILKRGNNASQGHVGFFKGFDDKGDVRVLGGNQSNGVNTQTFKKEDVLGFRRAPSTGDVAEDQFKEESRRLEQQADLNLQIDAENSKRRLTVANLKEQQVLAGEALIDAQREQAVQEALATARDRAAKNELTISDDRLKAIRESVEAEFDLINARQRASAALDDASGLRDALLGRLDLAERIGDDSEIAKIEAAITAIDDKLRAAIDKAIEFYKLLGDDNPVAQAAIVGLENQRGGIGLDTRDREQARVEKPLGDLQAQRNALIEQIEFYRELGQNAVSEQLQEQLVGVEADLLAAADAAVLFWQAQSGPEAAAALLNLENLRNQVLAAQNEFTITAGQIQDAFAGSLSDAFTTFAERLVETRDPLQALAEAGLQFAADFTRKLAEMGLELLAFQLASKIGFGGAASSFNSLLGTGSITAGAAALATAGGTVATGGAAVTAGAAALGTSAAALAVSANALLLANAAGGAGIFHGGGIAGSANRSRAVSPMWFAAATRYHSGGIAGLKPNEVPTILERGEEVLTRNDSRHRFNGGGAQDNISGVSGGVSQILAIGEDQIASAMRGASGRKVILTTIETERETIRTMLDG